MFQAVIFDMDGLMFDTERLAKQAWEQVGLRYGIKIGEDILTRIRGATLESSETVFHDVFGPRFPFREARAAKQDLLDSYIEQTGLPVKPGLTELLARLNREKLKTSVASSSPEATVERYLKKSQLKDCFDCVVSAEQVKQSKPAPDIFLTAARLLGVFPSACLVLEDSANGLYAAKSAGMAAVCIPDITLPEECALRSAAAVLPSLSEVWDWMERSQRRPRNAQRPFKMR